MMQLNTTFPLSKECTRDVFLRILYSFLEDSAHWNMIQGLDRILKEDFSASTETRSIHTYLQNDTVIVTMVSVNSGTTDILYRIIDGIPHISVRCCNEVDSEETRYAREIPKVLRMFFWKGLGGDDGVLPVTDTAIRIDNRNMELAELIFEDTFQSPVVYISATDSAVPAIDCEGIAYQLAGIAHVVYEANPYIASRLSEKLNGKRPYNGAVKIMYRDGSEFLIRTDERTPGSAKNLVIREVVKHVTNMPYSFDFDVSRIRADYLMEKLKGNEELTGIFEGILQDKDKRISELEKEVSEAKEMSARAKSKADTLSYNIGNLIPASGMSLVTTEKEFYPGEITDVLVAYLCKQLKQMDGDDNITSTRLFHVLSDIVKNNPVSGRPDELKEIIRHSIGKDMKIDQIDFKELEKAGFSYDMSGTHIKLVFGADPRYAFTLSKTPSDYRTYDNTIKMIDRVLF